MAETRYFYLSKVALCTWETWVYTLKYLWGSFISVNLREQWLWPLRLRNKRSTAQTILGADSLHWCEGKFTLFPPIPLLEMCSARYIRHGHVKGVLEMEEEERKLVTTVGIGDTFHKLTLKSVTVACPMPACCHLCHHICRIGDMNKKTSSESGIEVMSPLLLWFWGSNHIYLVCLTIFSY